MILSSPASSTRRNAGKEDVKVLKTHLPKVINELLSEPTVDGVLDHMQRDLREIGVEDFGNSALPTRACHSKSGYWGQELRKGSLHGTCIRASFKLARCSGIVRRP